MSTAISLPTTGVELVPIYVDLIAPAHGNVRSLFPVTYDIYNRTPYSQEVEVTMEASDAFMFSGNKQVPVHDQFLPDCSVNSNNSQTSGNDV